MNSLYVQLVLSLVFCFLCFFGWQKEGIYLSGTRNASVYGKYLSISNAP
jgi:hypothetical protein